MIKLLEKAISIYHQKGYFLRWIDKRSLTLFLVFKKLIVATNCPSGPYEMLFGGKFGYLVNIGDVEEMSLGIVKGLNGQLNELPINKVSELYNSNDVANMYLEVLFEI